MCFYISSFFACEPPLVEGVICLIRPRFLPWMLTARRVSNFASSRLRAFRRKNKCVTCRWWGSNPRSELACHRLGHLGAAGILKPCVRVPIRLKASPLALHLALLRCSSPFIDSIATPGCNGSLRPHSTCPLLIALPRLLLLTPS